MPPLGAKEKTDKLVAPPGMPNAKKTLFMISEERYAFANDYVRFQAYPFQDRPDEPESIPRHF
jgi:hypothetical protein